jgi:flavin-binding protein dodecin
MVALHKRWMELEDKHHQITAAIGCAQSIEAELGLMRKRQAELLLEIGSVVAEIQDAPVTTVEDFAALLDVALEHELDLAGDIASWGPDDYPMTARLLRALSRMVPGFEFNSLQRWLSSPGQFEQLMGIADRGRANRESSDDPGSLILPIAGRNPRTGVFTQRAQGRTPMPDHVYRIIEVAGSATTSIEDAIQNAVSRASRTLRGINWFEVLQTRGQVEAGKLQYQVVLKVGFTLEEP